MTLNFRTKRRIATDCTHEVEVHNEIAGMSRSVCEDCGRVSVGFVEDHIRQVLHVQPAHEDQAAEETLVS